MDKSDKIQILRQCPLFSALTPQELEHIEKIAVLQSYEKRSLIFGQDQPCLGFYLLVEGLVKIYRMSLEGKEQVLFLVQPRNTFAEASLFLGGKYPANAETIKKSTLFFIPKAQIITLLKSDANLSLKMMAGLSQWLHRLVNLVDSLTLKDAESRLATYLMNLAIKVQSPSSNNIQIQLPMAKNILASHLGITSETLSRTLRKFQTEKLISVDGKAVLIHNMRNLRELTGLE